MCNVGVISYIFCLKYSQFSHNIAPIYNRTRPLAPNFSIGHTIYVDQNWYSHELHTHTFYSYGTIDIDNNSNGSEKRTHQVDGGFFLCFCHSTLSRYTPPAIAWNVSAAAVSIRIIAAVVALRVYIAVVHSRKSWLKCFPKRKHIVWSAQDTQICWFILEVWLAFVAPQFDRS